MPAPLLRTIVLILLFIAGINPNPGPQCNPTPGLQQPHNGPHPRQQLNHPNDIRILQFNINGIRNKIDERTHYMTTRNITVAAIQETKLTSTAPDPTIPNLRLLP